MIVDRIDNLERYACLGKNFATAAEYVRTHDLRLLPNGRTAVDGSSVFINKSENRYEEKEEMTWEFHRKYADIQVLLKGSERFGWGEADESTATDAGNDCWLCSAGNVVDCTLSSGMFVIFLPPETHSPGNYAVRSEKTVKTVIKVLMDE